MQDPRSYDPSSHFVTNLAPPENPQPRALESAPLNKPTVPPPVLSEAKALPALEWILSEKSRAGQALDRTRELQDDSPNAIRERILSRMALQSAKEENAHFYDDRQIALITVIKCTRGDATSYADAVRSVLHCHPDEVFARITENRKAKLGKEYRLWFDAAGNLRPDAPKKASKSTPKNPLETGLGANQSYRKECERRVASPTTCVNGDSLNTSARKQNASEIHDGNSGVIDAGARVASDRVKLQNGDQADKARRRTLGVNSGSIDAPPAGVAAPADKKKNRGVA